MTWLTEMTAIPNWALIAFAILTINGLIDTLNRIF